MKKKGFTLIELLAVIVLLAIITVIAVPKILNVIEKSKESSAESSIKLAKDAIRTQIASDNALGNSSFIKNADNCYEFDFDNQEEGNAKELKVKNKEKLSGSITYCDGNFIEKNVKFNETASNGTDVAISTITINSKENIKRELCVGETIELSVTTIPRNIKVNYKSSNEKIATVNSNGIITGIDNGTVIITAYKENIQDQIEINVIKPNLYVSTGGNDETGNGTINNPYASLKKAIENANNGNTIYIKAGIYKLSPMFLDSDSSYGIYDEGKELSIYGENEKTILNFDNSTSTSRDGLAIRLSNKNTVIGNFTYFFKPTKNQNYSNAIFHRTYGTTKNVFFVINNSSKTASYDYFNNETLTHTVENCTFYHTKGSVSSNFTGSGIYKNIATNANPKGTLDNVVKESFTTETSDIAKIINDSKNNKAFNDAQAGVFYGENAWK